MKQFKKIFGVLTAIVFGVSLFSCGETETFTKVDGTTDINIYALNDFHGAFLESGSYVGMSRLGNYLIRQKTENPDNTIILSSGDMWQGTVESNLNHGALVTEAMNVIGFDSMTIGNHEFDWDEEYIKTNQKNMTYPLLACNIFYKGTENRPDYLKPYTVVTKGNFKIGIIGAVKENMGSSILKSISNKFDFPNPVKYVKECSDILFTKEDCDAVILSTHDGDHTIYEGLSTVSTVSNHPYISGLFLAHDHQVYNDYNGEVPYVEGGSSGTHIAEITLSLKRENKVTTVTSASGLVINASTHCLGSSEAINNVYAKYKDSIEAVKNEVVGFSSKTLNKKQVAKAVSQSFITYINSHQDEFGHKVNYACVNTAGVRSTIDPGKVTYGNIVTALPFDNFVVLVKLTKTQLDAYLSDSSNAYSFTSGTITADTDGYYYIATINYLSEIMEAKGNNTEVYTSTLIWRDVFKEEIMKGNNDTIVIYTNQPDPVEDTNEPAVVSSSVEGFVEASNDEDAGKYKYDVTGIVCDYTANEYGDMYLKSLTGDTKIFIYGLCATSSCFRYIGGEYTFYNSKDWLTNENTKNITNGDVIEVQIIIYWYGTKLEGLGQFIKKIS